MTSPLSMMAAKAAAAPTLAADDGAAKAAMPREGGNRDFALALERHSGGADGRRTRTAPARSPAAAPPSPSRAARAAVDHGDQGKPQAAREETPDQTDVAPAVDAPLPQLPPWPAWLPAVPGDAAAAATAGAIDTARLTGTGQSGAQDVGDEELQLAAAGARPGQPLPPVVDELPRGGARSRQAMVDRFSSLPPEPNVNPDQAMVGRFGTLPPEIAAEKAMIGGEPPEPRVNPDRAMVGRFATLPPEISAEKARIGGEPPEPSVNPDSAMAGRFGTLPPEIVAERAAMAGEPTEPGLVRGQALPVNGVGARDALPPARPAVHEALDGDALTASANVPFAPAGAARPLANAGPDGESPLADAGAVASSRAIAAGRESSQVAVADAEPLPSASSPRELSLLDARSGAAALAQSRHDATADAAPRLAPTSRQGSDQRVPAADLGDAVNVMPSEASAGRPVDAATSSAPAAPVLAAPMPVATSHASPAAAAAPLHARIDVAIDQPGFAPSLGAQLSLMARDGVQQARLQLHPAEMGPIDVKIAIDGSAARIDFHAAVAATREAIEASLPTLAAALRESGLTLAGGGVFQQASGQQPQNPQNPPSQSATPGRLDSGQARDAADAALRVATGRPLPRRGLLDLIA